jgi:hypothetical protein
VYEVDLVDHRSRELARNALAAAYTVDGYAVLAAGRIVLYHWLPGAGDAPRDVGRVAATGVRALRWAYHGLVLVADDGDRTGFLAVDGGSLHALGATDGGGWFATWDEGDDFYLQAERDGQRRLRVSGFDGTLDAARRLAPVTSLDLSEVRDLGARELPIYPGVTRWHLHAG